MQNNAKTGKNARNNARTHANMSMNHMIVESEKTKTLLTYAEWERIHDKVKEKQYNDNMVLLIAFLVVVLGIMNLDVMMECIDWIVHLFAWY